MVSAVGLGVRSDNMYSEFIAIYIGLAVLIALMVVVLVFVLKLANRFDPGSISKPYVSEKSNSNISTTSMTQPNISTGKVVFCKHCAAKFDASQNVCPMCGTPR